MDHVAIKPGLDTDAVRGARQSELDLYLKDNFDGLKVGRLMSEGDAASEINEYARENGTDLIMMPTHGYGIFRSLLLGSVTAKCCTMLPVRYGPAFTSKKHRLPLQPSPTLCAPWISPTKVSPPCSSHLQAFLQDEARKALAKMQQGTGLVAQLCLGAGEVPHVVRDAALHHAADLLVIGRGHATRALGRLRTNVYSIIRRSPCPVISV